MPTLGWASVPERPLSGRASRRGAVGLGEVLDREPGNAQARTSPRPTDPRLLALPLRGRSGTLAQPSVGMPGGVYSGFAQISSYAFAPLRAVRTRSGPVSSTGVTC